MLPHYTVGEYLSGHMVIMGFGILTFLNHISNTMPSVPYKIERNKRLITTHLGNKNI